MKYKFLTACGCLLLASCAVTVDPMSSAQFRAFGEQKIAELRRSEEKIAAPISLYEAMARAIKYNLDAQVEIMEMALRRRELGLSNYSMLPNLVASSGYNGRSVVDRSSLAGSDTGYSAADLTFSWNILDFGLSYLRAKQAADQALIQDEMKRKIVNRVMEDVRTAFWRAASYERLVGRMRALEGKIAKALRESRSLSVSGENSPLIALTYERQLIEIKREIETLEDNLIVAKTQLAALMNVTPGTKFTLRAPKRETVKLNLPDKPYALFEIAAANRPEMRDMAYRMRVNEHELSAALLALLPSFNIFASANLDTNEALANQDWISWGAKISWNLLRLTSIEATRGRVKAEQTALETRALSVAMAIMTQVHIGRLRYQKGVESYRTANALAAVSHRILDQVRAELVAERSTEQTLIREEMNTLLADAKRDIAHTDVQNAYANIYASLGLDPFPQGLDTKASVADLAKALEAMWVGREKTPVVIPPAAAPAATQAAALR